MARTAADANDPDFVERATRAGSFALFLYSIASLGFSVVLPVFVRDDDDNAMAPTMRLKLSLRSMWRLSLVAMCVVLLMTYIVADVRGATVLIIAMAFPWSLAMWAPFALVGEYVSIASAANSEGGGSAGEEAAQSSTAQPVVAQMVPGSSRSSRKGVYGACDDDSDSEMLLGRSMCDDLDDDEFIVGSQSTAARWAQPDAASAAAAPSKRQSELAGHLAVVQRRGFAVRGDSIASTIGAEEPSLPPNSTRVQLLKTLPLRAGEDDRLVEHSNSSSSAQPRREKLESGAILGIHNMYVVLPQFVINALSSLVFAWLGGGSAEAGNPGDSGSSQAPLLRSVEFMAMDAAFSTLSGGSAVAGGREAVGTVLRIGGASALVAAVLTLFLFDRRHVREYISAIQQ
ncbi:hypothetical protein EV175_006551 [Coemansia sp. RSA 1933]|nr:hypothetical protein EV175_006551 [Coemansia sp. RSA 1933]